MKYLILGSYSTQKRTHIGQGVTKREQRQAVMWLAVQLPSTDICVQPLDPSNVPTGIVSTVVNTDFFQTYIPESDCYEQYIRPGVKKLSDWIGTAGRPMPQGTPDRETGMFLRGFLSILHGEGGMAMRTGDPDILRMLVAQALAMRFFEHFQIGISTAAIRQRKERNYPLAIDFYLRALEIKETAHLLFNAARTYYEMKNIDAATNCLTRALVLSPEFTIAEQFLQFIVGSPAS